MKTLLLATGQEKMDEVITTKLAPELGYKVVGEIGYKSEFIEAVKDLKPDLAIISKNLTGKDVTVLEAILTTKRECPNVRIIFLAGALDEKNKEKVNELATLVMSGVYDILHEKTFKIDVLRNLIKNPKERSQVQYLLKYNKANVINEDELVEIEEEQQVKDIEENGYSNVFYISSIKPGSGKTFISTNLATGIAKYGKKKPNGDLPKVAIIDADLQNLAVGTVLQIENNEKNLKTVMQKISTIIDSNNNLIDDELKISMVNNFIKSAFLPYKHTKNLFALVGSQLTMEEVSEIKPIYYIYLIEQILDDYDVVIIDGNSSLEHISTYALLKLCKTAFYVIDLDFNNIRNNCRYQSTLKELETFDKIKYVLNQDVNTENRNFTGIKSIENLAFDSNKLKEYGFNTIAQIPELPKEVFLNRLYEGKPVILDDNNNYTLKARIEISKIANTIWDIDNFNWLNSEYEAYKEKMLNQTKKRNLFK